uniref:Uncharacterized protein n=1 Tax=Lepeophtheirus salmonis TaxID=72036 RepID=A0A0K2V0C5_LEPSM
MEKSLDLIDPKDGFNPLLALKEVPKKKTNLLNSLSPLAPFVRGEISLEQRVKFVYIFICPQDGPKTSPVSSLNLGDSLINKISLQPS